ncbi:phenylacetate--CoA ligase family protein [Candidatus Daviesbacteria bacterium]|nr:phenylacetate--CoA ligase family protein [Candidatus Daviesbacteria bacterium]
MSTANHLKKSNQLLFKNWLFNQSFYDTSLLKNEALLIKIAKQKALKLFHSAALRVPAYKDFLKKKSIKPSLIKTFADFEKIPVTSKENYIETYSMKERCWDGQLEGMHMISTSSGTTGKPLLWPRDLISEIEGAFAHELILKNIFSVDKKKTLFLNGFAMGNWIAGTFTTACVNLVSWKGYKLTLMTPGYVLKAIVDILQEEFINDFDQIILTGHTPFLKEIVEEIVKQKINLTKIDFRLLGTGQAISENWRDYLINLLKGDETSVINLYGSADAALMGFETPLSIKIRKFIFANQNINKKLFQKNRFPSIYNFDPRLTFFEAIDGELCITKNSGCPLIKYNIHDEGGVLKNQELSSLLSEDVEFQLPFVYLFGREKFMVKFFGANLYSEHIQFALNHQKLQPFITGRYLAEVGTDESHNDKLIFKIELASGVNQEENLVKLIQETFMNEVKKINSEYDYVLNQMGVKAIPEINLFEHGHPDYFPLDKIKKNG